MDVSLDSFGVLQIEPTDRCNLRCNMCLPHHLGFDQIHGVPKGLMDLALYKRIIDGLVAEDCRFDHVIFQWLGDPSLHPELEEMLAHAQDRLYDRVRYLRVDTNAIVLTPKRMARIVEVYARRPEVPLLMVFTLDALTPETYARVKGQDALERVRRNIRHFVMQRARLPFDDVRLNVQLQFVLQPGNEHEVSDFITYWRDFLGCHGKGKGYSEIMIKRLSVDAGGEGQREADELYERTCRDQGVAESADGPVHVKVWNDRPWESTAHDEGPAPPRQPCPGLWMTPVIRHDGHLMMCCADLQGELDLGDLGQASFRTLWDGTEAVQRRLAHVRGAFDEVGPCESCGGINWYRTPPEVVESWLEGVGELSHWPAYADRMGLTP
jgi:MoaA/NifB/PqqE/SkfB family radical SAM enzyme